MAKIGFTNFILPRTFLDYHIFIKERMLVLTPTKLEVHSPVTHDYTIN